MPDRYVPLEAAVTLRESERARLVEVSCNTDRAGLQTAEVWIPKSQSRVDGGTLDVAAWLVEKLEEKIAETRPEFGAVGLRVAGDPNQLEMEV